ncbi:MAG: methylated-DNA--[protein]-cysteine S-methyltransferase [Chloroflexota bacterium]
MFAETELTAVTQETLDYNRIAQAIHYLAENFREQPTLKETADYVGLSEYHFQRLFSRWAGISPKKFAQYLTVDYAKSLLDESQSLLNVTLETGLSSPGRLHDLFVTFEAVTPGQYKSSGQGLTITYGLAPTPFGICLLAQTERGICSLQFVDEGQQDAVLADLQKRWPGAEFVEDKTAVSPTINQIFYGQANATAAPFKLYLQGTNFQIRVWEALLKIPQGYAASYDMVATMMGQPTAVRALASAVARNPVGYLIPCHRVIRKTGAFGQYHWGETRKKALLGWEATQKDSQQLSVTSNP